MTINSGFIIFYLSFSIDKGVLEYGSSGAMLEKQQSFFQHSDALLNIFFSSSINDESEAVGNKILLRIENRLIFCVGIGLLEQH